MKTVTLKQTVIGEDRPKICIPIVAKTAEQILQEAQAITDLPADLVEWRADFFEGVHNLERVTKVLHRLNDVLSGIPLLFTFRTAKEGGEQAISAEEYSMLNRAVCESKLADCIDVELFSGDALMQELIAAAHTNGVAVIASNHDFQQTPPKAELLSRLLHMQKLDADILKIAVMPRSSRDVLELLAATDEMVTLLADRPVVTMSMGGLGVVSRLCGETFGSALTFGAASQASAPGQIGAQDLSAILDLLHQSAVHETKGVFAMKQKSNIILIGFMGAGKTTVSHHLSHLLAMQEVDTDRLIAEREGMSIPELFRTRGEAYFRDCETKLLLELQQRHNLIVSCGGGMALRPENAAYMKQAGCVVLLTATPQTIYERVKDNTNRPLLNGNMNADYIENMLNKRRERYLAAADVIVETDGKTISEICADLIDRLPKP